MKNPENLTKYYGDFTPMERLNLVIAASARGDDAEIGKLFKTCPRREYHYFQRDAAFMDKYKQMTDVSLLFTITFKACSDAVGLFSSYSMFFEEQIDIYEWAIEHIGQDETKKDDIIRAQNEIKQLAQLITLLDEKYEQQIIKMKSVLEAYREFCNEIGVQAENALEWLENKDFIAMFLQFCEEISIDEEFSHEMKSSFYKIWRLT